MHVSHNEPQKVKSIRNNVNSDRHIKDIQNQPWVRKFETQHWNDSQISNNSYDIFEQWKELSRQWNVNQQVSDINSWIPRPTNPSALWQLIYSQFTKLDITKCFALSIMLFLKIWIWWIWLCFSMLHAISSSARQRKQWRKDIIRHTMATWKRGGANQPDHYHYARQEEQRMVLSGRCNKIMYSRNNCWKNQVQKEQVCKP